MSSEKLNRIKKKTQDHIGKEINLELSRRGWNQKTLAQKADLTEQYISNLLNYKAKPAKTTLRRIARALDLPDDHFIQSDDRPKPSPETVRKRLVFEFYLPDGLDLTTEETVMLRKQVEQSVHNIFNWLKDLKNKK